MRKIFIAVLMIVLLAGCSASMKGVKVTKGDKTYELEQIEVGVGRVTDPRVTDTKD